jgi:signal transduction histidine kinase/DNA-binding response OmpR family regulator/ligand-binding sensor domain-containing protein
MKPTVILYIVFVLFVKNSFCGDFRYLRTNEGLYNGEINSIAQDQSGKMWFATWAGLTSYNGYNFQFYKPELGNLLSLFDKKTNKIFIDSNDNLWVASLSGVSVFLKSDQTFHPIYLDGQSTKSFYTFGFIESKGNILIHCSAGVFLVYKSKSGNEGFQAKRLKLYEGNTLAPDYVHYMQTTFNNRLILVSHEDQYNPTRLLLSELVVNATDTLIKVQNRIVYGKHINTMVAGENSDKMYLGTSDGISVLSLSRLIITDYVFAKGLNIQNLLLASDHRLYFNSTDPALMFVDLQSFQTGQYLPDPFQVGSLLDNNITCLFEDFSRNLWVGHQGLGLSILNLNRKAFYTFKRDPSNPKSMNGNIVMCFNGTAHEIFIGLRQGGINVTSKQINKDKSSSFQVLGYRQQANPVSLFDNIWDIARESDSVFWVASTGGLAKLEKTRNGWVYGRPNEQPLYQGTVRKILIDKNHNIWCGTADRGLIFFPALSKNPGRKFYQFSFDAANPEGISDRAVISMLIDSKNCFWVGTNNGLNLLKTPYDKLDLSGNSQPFVRFKQFIATKPQKDFLNANEINCIFENNDGKLWVATQGGGINIMNTDSDTFSHLTTENGLPGNDVQGILSDRSGKKWVSTNKGIVAIDLDNKAKTYTYYNQSDGIQGETFKVNSWYESSDGEMFFGGDNGFTRFYPRDITFNPIPPKIGLTYLRILNQVVKVGDTLSRGNIMDRALNETDNIVLPYQKNSFSIGVGVHHYQFPEGNMIRYKLEGFSDRWITLSATNQYIYFSKIPDGRYTLHISGYSADNVEATQEKVLHIRILPPWYKTWYMSTVFVLLIIGLIGGIIYMLIRRQRISFEKKIDSISFESNENKMKFLTNIAHELRTPLSLVVAPIEDMMQNYTNIEPKWKNHLNLIYRNSNYLLTLINQIIDFRKLNAGKLQLNLQVVDLVALVKDVSENFKGLESRRKANLKVQVPDKSILAKIDSQKIEEVLYNLLSNAFKHTSENNSIMVSLEVVSINSDQKEEEKKQIRITVFNEGKDISDEDKVKIFERFYKVSENVEGAGIGLSFSKSLIEMHLGKIEVESVNGVGVAFHVLLPFDEIDANDFTTNLEKPDFSWNDDVYESEQINELENKGKDLTIVIVEDNIDLRTFLKNALAVTYNCYEASDGREGYDLICRIIPDIVISDVVMPKMDGYELCEKIKENSKTCHIPIILLTANNASEHIVSGYEKGADAYVTKPFDMSVIKAQISRLIKNRELIREKYMTHNFMVEVSTSNLTRDDEFIVKLRQLLEDNLSESDFNVKKLSSDLNISTTHLYRKLKALTGLSPVEFIRMFKLHKACELLSNSNLSIKEIGYSLGFNNLSYFVKCFREQFNVTPSAFRQKGMPNTGAKNSTNQSGVA